MVPCPVPSVIFPEFKSFCSGCHQIVIASCKTDLVYPLSFVAWKMFHLFLVFLFLKLPFGLPVNSSPAVPCISVPLSFAPAQFVVSAYIPDGLKYCPGRGSVLIPLVFPAVVRFSPILRNSFPRYGFLLLIRQISVLPVPRNFWYGISSGCSPNTLIRIPFSSV